MSNAIPPSNGAGPAGMHQVEEGYQEPTPAEATVVQPSPESVAPHDTESLRERMLTPEETESMLRGVMPSQEDATSVAEQRQNEEQSQMAGDFFADVPGEQQRQLTPTPAAQPDPAPTAPQLPPAAPVPQAPQVAQPQVPQAPLPQASPAESALQAQNQMLQQSLQAMQTQMANLQAAQAQPSPQAQQAQAASAPRFNFQVPAGHMQALGAEDAPTRQAALDSILNGVANTMYQQFQQELDERISSAVPQSVQQQVNAHAERQNVHQDMYGTYPELSAHSNLVFATAEQLQAQGLGAAGWTPDFRDMIAERLAPMVPGLSQKVQSTRAQRMAAMGAQPPMVNPGAQMPQQQGALPPSTLPPGSVVGGAHGQAAPQPVLVRNASGQIVPMVPQQSLAGPQARPSGMGLRVDPAVQDIWNTLGY